jgi:hypothetical protein
LKYFYFLTAVFLLGSCTSTQPVREQISVNLRAPKFSIGTIEAQFDQSFSFGKLRKGEIEVHYHPVDDIVSIQYKVDFIKYFLHWNRINREKFIIVLKQYHEEFNQRTLIRRNSITKWAYGNCPGFSGLGNNQIFFTRTQLSECGNRLLF